MVDITPKAKQDAAAGNRSTGTNYRAKFSTFQVPVLNLIILLLLVVVLHTTIQRRPGLVCVGRAVRTSMWR